MTSVIIYTWGFCPYCDRAKDLLQSKDVSFEEVSLDGKDKDFEELKKKTGWKTVPQIFIRGKFIGGFQELAQLEEEEKLDSLLTSDS